MIKSARMQDGISRAAPEPVVRHEEFIAKKPRPESIRPQAKSRAGADQLRVSADVRKLIHRRGLEVSDSSLKALMARRARTDKLNQAKKAAVASVAASKPQNHQRGHR